ncbi:hypothetical protein [Xenorhabdus indica]|uniref:hypothetical protein n=1 Tax=Xenorhabdus indica TaxID=333964 RepID=UPI0021D4C8CC|nr:hypothetical protein [Xenorhabdus indica]
MSTRYCRLYKQVIPTGKKASLDIVKFSFFNLKNAVSDSLCGEAGVSLSELCCPLVAASLSAVNLQKVTPCVL